MAAFQDVFQASAGGADREVGGRFIDRPSSFDDAGAAFNPLRRGVDAEFLAEEPIVDNALGHARAGAEEGRMAYALAAFAEAVGFSGCRW